MLKTISNRSTRLSPLTKAMRAARPRVAAWNSLDRLHAAAAPGSGRTPRTLSSGEAGLTDRAILRVLVDAGAVASSADLDARLVCAALSVGITLHNVVPPGSCVEPKWYINEMFPGSRVLQPGDEKAPEVAASLVQCSGPSSWALGRIPSSSRGLYLSKSMFTALGKSMVSRCLQLLQAAQAVADMEEVNSGDGDDTSDGDSEDESMDADSDGEGAEGGRDGEIDKAPRQAEGVTHAGCGEAPASAGAGSGFYSCESSQERARDEAGGVKPVNPLNEMSDEPVLQPRVFNTGRSNLIRKQGTIHKFFGSVRGQNSPGGGGARAKSLHCVTPADGPDKENLTSSPHPREFAPGTECVRRC